MPRELRRSICCGRTISFKLLYGLVTLHHARRRLVTISVTNNPRFAGQSHYGVWNRLFASFYDLLAVRWMKKRMFRYQVAERVN